MPLRVLVVGSGAGALFLAALLSYRGNPNVLVVEGGPLPLPGSTNASSTAGEGGEDAPTRDRSYGEGGRLGSGRGVVELWGNSVRLLRGIELSAEELGASVVTTVKKTEVGSGEEREEQCGRGVVFVDRHVLLNALRLKCIELGVQVELGVNIHKLVQYDEAAEIQLSNGAVGKFDVVVAADGVDCVAGASHPPIFYDARMWSLISETAPPGDLHTMQEMWSDDGSVIPLSESQCGVRCCLPVDMPNRREAPEEILPYLTEAFRDFGKDVVSLIRGVQDPASIIVEDLLEVEQGHHRTSDGRLVWLGEAADILRPSLGVNVAFEMESAACLCEELGRCTGVWKDLQHTMWLYKTRRARRRDEIQKAAIDAAEKRHSSSSWNPLSLMGFGRKSRVPTAPFVDDAMCEIMSSKW